MDSKEFKKEMKRVRELQYKLDAETFGPGGGRMMLSIKVIAAVFFLLILASVIQFLATGKAIIFKFLKGF